MTIRVSDLWQRPAKCQGLSGSHLAGGTRQNRWPRGSIFCPRYQQKASELSDRNHREYKQLVESCTWQHLKRITGI